MIVAHFSDVHITHSPFLRQPRSSPPAASSPALGISKRWSGSANYYLGGRGRHFSGAKHRIERLLSDIRALGCDHVLCTGDVTQMSAQTEFEEAREALDGVLGDPSTFTIIPGNHDRYTLESELGRWFEQSFGEAAPRDYPHLKWVSEEVALVLIDTSHATGLIDSSGWCGETQLRRLEAMLTDHALDGCFVILAMHYGLRRSQGQPDRRRHALRDDAALEAVLANPSVRAHLVVHGHMHRPYAVAVSGRKVLCVGSGTDLAHQGGWHRIRIDSATNMVGLERRVWSREQDRYVSFDHTIPNQEILGRPVDAVGRMIES